MPDHDRLAITHPRLEQRYPVELVAQLAAGCAGENPRARIEAALALLRETERVAFQGDPSIGPWLGHGRDPRLEIRLR